MRTLEFQLDRDFVELNQLLKLSGLCDSGGAGKALVGGGGVSVDGVREMRKTRKIRAGQRVRLAGVEIRVSAAQSSEPKANAPTQVASPKEST